jgi:hypothetical protein
MPFIVLGKTDIIESRTYYYKIRCIYCNKKLSLCPLKKNLLTNLQNFLRGEKHETAVEMADNPNQRRPATSTRHRGSTDVLFRESGSVPGLLALGDFLSIGNNSDQVMNRNALIPFLCWGYWRSTCVYAGLPYSIKEFLNDPNVGVP